MIERSIWLYNIFQDVYSFSLLFTLWSQNLIALKKKNSPRNRKTRTKSPSWRRALSEGKFYRRAFGSIDCPILSEIFPPILGRKVYETFITRITLLFLHVYVGQCTRERRGGQGFSRGINHAMRAIRRKKGFLRIHPWNESNSFRLIFEMAAASTHFSRIRPPLSAPDRFEQGIRVERGGGWWKGFLSRRRFVLASWFSIGLGASNRRCNLGLGNVV